MYNFENICCLCVNENNLIGSLFDYDANDSKKYIEKLKFVFPDLLLDELESFNLLCEICRESLNNAFEFKYQCINASIKRKQTINTQVIKVDDVALLPEISLIEEANTNEINNYVQDDVKTEENMDMFSNSSDIHCENGEEEYLDPNFDVSNEENDNSSSAEEPVEKKVRIKRNCVGRAKKIETETYVLDYKEKFFVCKICSKQFTLSKTLRSHMQRHTGNKKYTCATCDKKFYTISERQGHETQHSTDIKFTCSICAKSFKDKYKFNTHVKKYHTETRQYMCDACGKTFINICTLNVHKLVHTDKKEYECNICQAKLKSPSSLIIHMDRHKNKTYSCELCTKTYKSYAALFRHNKVVHIGGTRFKCEVCAKMYYYRSDLNDHMKTHIGAKPFPCDQCGNFFGSKYTLKNHMLTHTGERPHQCEVCHKTFAQTGTLLVHMRLHNGVRPYKCEICDKGFIKSHHYDNHMNKYHKSDC